MNRVSLLVKTRDPGRLDQIGFFLAKQARRVNIYYCVIPTKIDVALQDHVSHERWEIPFVAPRSLT